MGRIKEININILFFDDMINIKNFHSNLVKVDKKSYKDNDICYICYITIKKFDDCENIHSVNLLYLIIHLLQDILKKKTTKNTEFLIRQTNMKRFCQELDQKLKNLMVEKNFFIKKNYARIGINTDDLPLNKPLKFPTLTITIRCFLQDSEKLYLQIYLDE